MLNHKNPTLERGWTKAHGHFIQMGGFMLFEGNVAKGVLSPERFSELLAAGKIEFPTLTLEEIEDRSKADGFSKTIALGQTLWFVAQCIARRAQNLDLTLIELLTLSLAVLNGLMYFLWWHKSLDVRCPIRIYLLDKPIVPNEPNEFSEPNKPSESNEPSETKPNEPRETIKPCEPLANKPSEPNKASELNKPSEPKKPSKLIFRCEFY